MGTSDLLIERMEEENDCRYGYIQSQRERKIIDIFYEWIEKSNLNPEGCIDNTGDHYDPSFELDVSNIEENSEAIFQRKLMEYYESKGYRAEVAIQNSKIQVSINLGERADDIDPDEIEN